tara:strand:- start:95 stop:574 length:480 start_codon:yes stop_codon:yes gene_type:complete
MKIKDSELDYKARNIDRINVAEEEAEKFFKASNISYKHLGFDEKNENISPERFYRVPKVVRCLPDYIAIGNDAKFVEVKGFVDDLTIKDENYEEYQKWDRIMPLLIFAHDAQKKVSFIAKLKQITDGLHLFTKGKHKDNGKPFFRIDWQYMKDNFQQYG